MTDHIQTALADRILTIRLARPDKKNAITVAMYDAMAQALERAAADREVRVVLFAGSADCFTAGNDIMDFLQQPPQGADSPVGRFMQGVIALPKPLIAAVNGVAVGIGVTLLLHCDLVYAGEQTRLQMPFVNIGVVPELASTYLLPLAIGPQRAAQLMMLGEAFTAQQALELGLVSAVLPNARTEDAAREAARKLAGQPPAALRACKALLRAPHAAAVAKAMQVEVEHFMPMLRAAEAREAMTAFMQKRPPDFSKFD